MHSQTNGAALAVTPQPGGVVRHALGATEMEVRETAAIAVAEREKAAIQAMFLVAQAHPRDWDNVRAKMLKDAQRYAFADAAIWELPRGGKTLTGPSIRFAEAAIRCMGNVFIDMQVTLDALDRRKVQVVIIDLENNVRFAREVQIDKTVERKKLPKDFDPSQVIATRSNSYGDKVFIVPATEDETTQKQAVQISKVIRTEGLRLLPGDILEEVIAACEATIAKGIKDDPDAAKKKLADGFAKLNVTPADLASYLGHPLGQVSPAELVQLRAVYQAIAQGETTWHRVLQEKAEGAAAKVKAPTAPSAQPVEAPSSAAAAQPEQKAEPLTEKAEPHDPVTGVVHEDPPAEAVATTAAPAPKAAPAGDDPDSFTDRLLTEMSAAVEANNLSALTKLAGKAKEVPADRQDEVLKHYQSAKQALKEKAQAGAAK